MGYPAGRIVSTPVPAHRETCWLPEPAPTCPLIARV
jgi:hypothetical protein